MVQDWRVVYQNQDTDNAYDDFFNIFITLYNKNCPIIHCIKKIKNKEHPWVTRGLQIACKKKNRLYREIIRRKTQEAEKKYKMYENN